MYVSCRPTRYAPRIYPMQYDSHECSKTMLLFVLRCNDGPTSSYFVHLILDARINEAIQLFMPTDAEHRKCICIMHIILNTYRIIICVCAYGMVWSISYIGRGQWDYSLHACCTRRCMVFVIGLSDDALVSLGSCIVVRSYAMRAVSADTASMLHVPTCQRMNVQTLGNIAMTWDFCSERFRMTTCFIRVRAVFAG